MTPTETALIVVVAKAPQVGSVKTRLCPPLTPEQAARLYTGFLLDTVAIALAVPGSAVKAVCPTDDDARQLSRLLPSAVGYFVQTEPGLTAALTGSFRQGLAEGYKKVLCISSDNPTLPQNYLHEALTVLNDPAVDLVLGPSEDGGYYLVGATKVYPPLFEDMVWSTDRVLAETLTRAAGLALRSHQLPLWYDLDTGTELARFVDELAQIDPSQAAAPHTRPLLVELGRLDQ